MERKLNEFHDGAKLLKKKKDFLKMLYNLLDLFVLFNTCFIFY